MQTITASKAQLRETLIENQQTHEADFQITWKKYKDALREEWSEKWDEISKLEPGNPIELSVYLPYPENHTEDYERAIQMLDWEQGDTITLSESEFKSLVMDNWSWKAGVTSANLMYAGSASPSKFR